MRWPDDADPYGEVARTFLADGTDDDVTDDDAIDDPLGINDDVDDGTPDDEDKPREDEEAVGALTRTRVLRRLATRGVRNGR